MFETLIDKAFKRAQENGDLDDLPGAGKPIKQSSLNADPFAHTFAQSGAMTPFGVLKDRISEARAIGRDERSRAAAGRPDRDRGA